MLPSTSNKVTSRRMCLTLLTQWNRIWIPLTRSLQEILYLTLALENQFQRKHHDFLLKLEDIGRNTRQQFIVEWIDKPCRFQERIPRQKIKSFSTECKPYKVKSRDRKLAAEMVRNVFEEILPISVEHKIHLAKIISHTLLIVYCFHFATLIVLLIKHQKKKP